MGSAALRVPMTVASYDGSSMESSGTGPLEVTLNIV